MFFPPCHVDTISLQHQERIHLGCYQEGSGSYNINKSMEIFPELEGDGESSAALGGKSVYSSNTKKKMRLYLKNTTEEMLGM